VTKTIRTSHVATVPISSTFSSYKLSIVTTAAPFTVTAPTAPFGATLMFTTLSSTIEPVTSSTHLFETSFISIPNTPIQSYEISSTDNTISHSPPPSVTETVVIDTTFNEDSVTGNDETTTEIQGTLYSTISNGKTAIKTQPNRISKQNFKPTKKSSTAQSSLMSKQVTRTSLDVSSGHTLQVQSVSTQKFPFTFNGSVSKSSNHPTNKKYTTETDIQHSVFTSKKTGISKEPQQSSLKSQDHKQSESFGLTTKGSSLKSTLTKYVEIRNAISERKNVPDVTSTTKIALSVTSQPKQEQFISPLGISWEETTRKQIVDSSVTSTQYQKLESMVESKSPTGQNPTNQTVFEESTAKIPNKTGRTINHSRKTAVSRVPDTKGHKTLGEVLATSDISLATEFLSTLSDSFENTTNINIVTTVTTDSPLESTLLVKATDTSKTSHFTTEPIVDHSPQVSIKDSSSFSSSSISSYSAHSDLDVKQFHQSEVQVTKEDHEITLTSNDNRVSESVKELTSDEQGISDSTSTFENTDFVTNVESNEVYLTSSTEESKLMDSSKSIILSITTIQSNISYDSTQEKSDDATNHMPNNEYITGEFKSVNSPDFAKTTAQNEADRNTQYSQSILSYSTHEDQPKQMSTEQVIDVILTESGSYSTETATSKINGNNLDNIINRILQKNDSTIDAIVNSKKP